MTVKHITTEALLEEINAGTTTEIVDVREVEEYNDGHIDGVINLPLSDFENNYTALDKNKPHYIICKRGGRSMNAAIFLDGLGYDVTNVEGGMDEWTGETVY